MSNYAEKKAYSIELSKAASNYFRKLDAPTKKRIQKTLRELAEDPTTSFLSIKKLVGRTEEYRLRVGNYRIIYEVRNNILVIHIIAIGPRGDVYK